LISHVQDNRFAKTEFEYNSNDKDKAEEGRHVRITIRFDRINQVVL